MLIFQIIDCEVFDGDNAIRYLILIPSATLKKFQLKQANTICGIGHNFLSVINIGSMVCVEVLRSI